MVYLKLLVYFTLPVFFLSSCSTSKRLERKEKRKADHLEKTKESGSEYKLYSEKFGIDFNGSENLELIQTIDKWLGVPHKMGGCSTSGTDCSCLVKNIYKSVYQIDLHRVSADIFKYDVDPLDRNRLSEGDLVFFKIDGIKISHVGIYIKNDKFVHASTSKGVIISDLQTDYYKNRFYSGGRVKR